MAVETGIYFHQHGSAVELPAGFGGMLQRQRHQYFSSLTKDEWMRKKNNHNWCKMLISDYIYDPVYDSLGITYFQYTAL